MAHKFQARWNFLNGSGAIDGKCVIVLLISSHLILALQSLDPCQVGQFQYPTSWQETIESLRNQDDDGNKNVTNLRIWQRNTIVLHALAWTCTWRTHFASVMTLSNYKIIAEMRIFQMTFSLSSTSSLLKLPNAFALTRFLMKLFLLTGLLLEHSGFSVTGCHTWGGSQKIVLVSSWADWG